jgi:hypothetical protein
VFGLPAPVVPGAVCAGRAVEGFPSIGVADCACAATVARIAALAIETSSEVVFCISYSPRSPLNAELMRRLPNHRPIKVMPLSEQCWMPRVADASAGPKRGRRRDRGRDEYAGYAIRLLYSQQAQRSIAVLAGSAGCRHPTRNRDRQAGVTSSSGLFWSGLMKPKRPDARTSCAAIAQRGGGETEGLERNLTARV